MRVGQCACGSSNAPVGGRLGSLYERYNGCLLPKDFHPVLRRWWAGRFGPPTEAQSEGWSAIRRGEHTLIAAPTGSGKTLAAFLTSIDQLFREDVESGG